MMLAIVPQEALGIGLKVLAVLGGALVGAVLVGAMLKLSVRLLTTKTAPIWSVRGSRLLGGGVAGWIVALYVFGGGGSGVGGSGNGLLPGKGEPPGQVEPPSKDATPSEKQPAEEVKLIRIEVLGAKALQVLKQAPASDYRGYRVEGEEALHDLESLKEQLRDRRRRVSRLEVTLVLYGDSPDRNLPVVARLEDWLRGEKLWNKLELNREPSPELRRTP